MPEDNTDLLFQLWRVRSTSYQMCRDRGYKVDDKDANMTLEQFKAQFGASPSEGNPARSDLNAILEREGGDDRIGLFFPDEPKVGIQPVRAIIENMRENMLDNAIVLVKTGMTPSARKALSDLAGQVQAFEDAELIVNITHHVLVPKHEVLSDAAKVSLMKQYKLKEEQLPRLRLADPVAKYYGMQRGQVVKITRTSPTAGRYVTYRLVH
eukprot:m.70401 g.70401  ORF g.70401 m.70401 type:complete len:210 (-) comp12128_c0_seq1:2134-2763(-)